MLAHFGVLTQDGVLVSGPGADTRNIRSQRGSTDVAAAKRTRATPAAPSTRSMPVHVHGSWSHLPCTHSPPLSLARRYKSSVRSSQYAAARPSLGSPVAW